MSVYPPRRRFPRRGEDVHRACHCVRRHGVGKRPADQHGTRRGDGAQKTRLRPSLRKPETLSPNPRDHPSRWEPAMRDAPHDAPHGLSCRR